MGLAQLIKEKAQRLLQLKRAFALVWQSSPRWTSASLVLVLLQALQPLLALYLMKLVVDAVASGLRSADKGLAFREVAWFIGMAGVVTLFGALLRSFASLVQEAQSQEVADRMYEILY